MPGRVQGPIAEPLAPSPGTRNVCDSSREGGWWWQGEGVGASRLRKLSWENINLPRKREQDFKV